MRRTVSYAKPLCRETARLVPRGAAARAARISERLGTGVSVLMKHSLDIYVSVSRHKCLGDRDYPRHMSPIVAIKPSARPISASAERFRESLHRVMQTAEPPYSQASLARAIREHQRTLGRILNGESTPTLDMAHNIAVALGTTLWDMLRPEPAESPAADATAKRRARATERA